MIKIITRLLFGGEEETPENVKSGEVLEEGWLVVGHQETFSAEIQDAELENSQPINAAPCGEETSVLDPEPTVQSSNATSAAASSYFPQPKALAEVTQLNCIHKAKTWANRHHMSRNALQRQNRVYKGVQHHSFHLKQPGHHNLCH